MQKKLYENWISATSFICSVMVVILHSSGFSKFTSNVIISKIILYFSHGISTVAVPTFFFLSGFLLFKNVDNISSLKNKLKKRVNTLIIPYIFWNVFYLLFINFGRFLKGGFKSLPSLSDVFSGVFFHKYVFNMWFLLDLIIYAFIFSFVVFYFRKIKSSILKYIIIIALILISFIFDPIVKFTEPGILNLRYFVYWLIGSMTTEKQINFIFSYFRKNNAKKIFSTISLIVILILSYFVMLSKNDIWGAKLENPLVFIITLSFIIFTITISNYMFLPKENIGMIIYGGHGVILIFVITILSKFSKYIQNGILIFVLYILTISFIVISIYLIGRFLKKYIKSIYLISAGGR